VYWDRGHSAIEEFEKQHQGPCGKNRFCKKLKIATIKVEDVKVTTPKKQDMGPLRHGTCMMLCGHTAILSYSCD
jgi:hypothetical protein